MAQETSLQYAAISDGALFICKPRKSLRVSDEVWKLDIQTGEKTITYVSFLNNSYVPDCWKKDGADIVFTRTYGNLPINGKCLIYKKEIQRKDPISVKAEYIDRLDSLLLIFENDTAKARAKMALNDLSGNYPVEISPLTHWLAANYGMDRQEFLSSILLPIGYDIVPLGENGYFFYLRNQKELSKWRLAYPISNDQVRKGRGFWEHVLTYSSDTVKMKAWYDNLYSLEEQNVRFQAIGDPLFFQGHFFVVVQAGREYLINKRTGCMYLLAEGEIVKVGEIRPSSSGSEQQELPNLVIENLDQERILIFGEWHGTEDAEFPPNIREIVLSEGVGETIGRLLRE